MSNLFETFSALVRTRRVRPARDGKHAGGSRSGSRERRRLLAARKRERQAVRLARLVAAGQKHRSKF